MLGSWYSLMTFPAGSRNLAMISGVSTDWLNELPPVRDDRFDRAATLVTQM
jgi:hypothetical protein